MEYIIDFKDIIIIKISNLIFFIWGKKKKSQKKKVHSQIFFVQKKLENCVFCQSQMHFIWES